MHHPDVLMVFNRPSLEKFAPSAKKGGLITCDSLAGQFQASESVKAIPVPATGIAPDKGVYQAMNYAKISARVAIALVDQRPFDPSSL